MASPRNDANPTTSVNVVMNTDEPSAGSTLSAFKPSGTSVPAVAATNRLMSIAMPSTRPSIGSPFVAQATPAATNPERDAIAQADGGLPWPAPCARSTTTTRPSARPRTITVSVCVAALPPMPATMGMKIASAVTC